MDNSGHSSEKYLSNVMPAMLNESQRLKLRVSCQYIDKLLADVESILHAASSKSPFGKYIADVNPAQTRVLEDHIRRIRDQLLRSLAWQHMKPQEPAIPATRAILTDLSFIDIAVEELRPRYLRGSGPVSEEAAAELNGVVHELRSALEGMSRYLRQELGTNVETRLARLQQTGADVSLLQRLSQAVNEHGLVEFRGRVETLTTRLEDPSFEIALFGRVSTGKSSLLNALLGADILPVGVNPITAVPTKLRSGPAPRAVITFADGRHELVTLQDFPQYVTEEGNPGNERNVLRAIAEIQAPRLKESIVLVDTPGLGSLARRGAAETLAYLPSADLGLVLIDAGSTVSEEDIGTVRLLYEAGIPPLVVLSKADLLQARDLDNAKEYIGIQLQRELGAAIPIHAVSALRSHVKLLDDFFERELMPRFHRATALRLESVSRKIGALRDSVMAAMEMMLDQEGSMRRPDEPATAALEMRLRKAIGEIGEQPRLLDQDLLMLEESSGFVVSRLAERALAQYRDTGVTIIRPNDLSEWVDELVEEQLRGPMQRLRESAKGAMLCLQEIAGALHSVDIPSLDEVEVLLHDLPRFELTDVKTPLSVRPWNLLGSGIALARLRSQLEDSLRGVLKEALHAYGRALYQWTQQTTRKLERLVNSYADAYRMQIHRRSGIAGTPADSEKLNRDLEELRQREKPTTLSAI